MKNLFYLFLLFLGFQSCSNTPAVPLAPPPPSLPIVQIKSGNDTTFQEYPATVEGLVNVDIRPQVNGILEKVYFDEGAYVQKGNPLFKINDRLYRSQLNNAKASEHGAEASLLNARLEIEKITPLVQNKVISEFQLKTAKASQEIALANLEQAKATTATAKINLGYTTLYAPVNGYIGRLLKKQGSIVAPGDATYLTQLSDIHEVHVYFSLSEKDFINFKEQYSGETLRDKLNHLPKVSLVLAGGKTFLGMGKVDMVDGQFDKTTGAITLRASFNNPQGILRSGNTGRIRLGLLHQNSLMVPQTATLEIQDKTFVFLLADSNRVKKQAITILGKSGENYLVRDGIKEGDQIVLSGLDHLQEGTIIHPIKTMNGVAKN